MGHFEEALSALLEKAEATSAFIPNVFVQQWDSEGGLAARLGMGALLWGRQTEIGGV